MPGFNNYTEGKILSQIFGSQAWVAPATIYVALLTALPADTDTGSTMAEVAYTDYARLAFANNTTNFPTSSWIGTMRNAVAGYFATCGVTAGTVVAFALMDALTAGNIICWGSLVTNKIISSGDVPQIAIGDLTIALD